MQFPIPHLTSLILIYHLALGCCWHHAYTCRRKCDHNPPSLATAMVEPRPCVTPGHEHAEPGHGRQHLSGATPSQDGRYPSGHHCSADHCTFVRWAGSSGSASGLRADTGALDTTPSVTSVNRLLRRLAGWPLHRVCEEARPLPSYLLFRALLI